MPKKTKKQKLISEYRRKISAISSPNISVSPVQTVHVPPPVSPPTISLVTVVPSQVTRPSAVTNLVALNEFAVIKKDLIETLIITTVILVGECAIARYIHF